MDTISLMSLEGVATQFGLLPVTLMRETISAETEVILRKLGRTPQSAEPWLPFSCVGPLLIFGHYSPNESDLCGVPPYLAVRVAISKEQYDKLKNSLIERLSASPLPASSTISISPPNVETGDLIGAFKWLLENYPYDPSAKTRLSSFFADILDKQDSISINDCNNISPSLGIALQYLTQGPSLLCFNPNEVMKQSKFPIDILENFNVYPAYVGNNKVYLLSETLDNYSFEDEWISLGHDPIDIVSVLSDGKLIKSLIGKSSSSSNVSQNSDAGIGTEIDTEAVSVTSDESVIEISPEEVNSIDPQDLNHSAEELLHWVIYNSLMSRASDLHLEKYYNVVRFRARIDGKMKTIFTAPEEMLLRFVALIKNYSNMSQSRQEALDSRFSFNIGSRRVDVRVAAVPCRNEFQKVIMRFLDKQEGLKKLSDLHLTTRQTDVIKTVMSRDQGLALITGPTGSGKTTTLYALIGSVNEEGVNIHTIEDPIEFEIEGINQTQTNSAHDLTFAKGLRALLRADPDVILIGECRDQETANSAITASLTGHLVLTTLHANDSLRAISRLLSMGVESHLVADSLAMSEAQRLMRRLCPYCKVPIPFTKELLELFKKQETPIENPNTVIYEGKGCSECSGSGYSGRVALMEMAQISKEMSDLIEAHATQLELRKAASKTGFKTLYQEGLIHVLAGNTSLSEIKKVSYTAL